MKEKLDGVIQSKEPIVFFPNLEPKVENPSFIAKKTNQRYSSWKLMAVAELIKGRHFTDALKMIDGSDKKGADIMRSVLVSAKINGMNRGFDSERFFV